MDLINSYKENGYVIVKNIVDESLLDNHLLGIYNIFKIYCKPSDKLDNETQPWKSIFFHNEIVEFRKSYPKLFSCFYDSLQNCSTLTALVFSKNLIELSSKLLKINTNQLITVGQQTRVDVPNDNRNILNWHQDWSYFPTTTKALTFWLPLLKMNDDTGYLRVLKNSHKAGAVSKISEKLDENKLENQEYTVTHQVNIPNNIINKYKDIKVKITRGDVVFFDTCLFHRSGNNISDSIRFSCQNRLQDATAPDYVPFRLNIKTNPFKNINET